MELLLTNYAIAGGSKDYIVVGSDSGKITILEYNPQKNVFDRVHMETFGKSGCRRIVPGMFLYFIKIGAFHCYE